MALSFKQRRRRDIIIGIIAAAIIVSFGFRKELLPLILGPGGFAKHAPVGQFTPLDWTIMNQAQEGNDGYQVPQAISSLNGMLVSLHGYTSPISKERETNEVIILEVAKGESHDGHDHEHDEAESSKKNEAVLVSVGGGKKLQVSPCPMKVTAYGKLVLKPDRESNALYIIEDAVVVLER